jgi:hypothetical protein
MKYENTSLFILHKTSKTKGDRKQTMDYSFSISFKIQVSPHRKLISPQFPD